MATPHAINVGLHSEGQETEIFMKIFYTLSLLLLLCSHLLGQKLSIDNQRKFDYRMNTYLDTIGFEKPNFKELNLCLRVWKDNYATGQKKMIQILQFKNGDWDFQSLDYYCYNANSCDLSEYYIESIAVPPNWNSIWTEIVAENLLNIRTQKEADELVLPKGVSLAVADGGAFTFEVCTKKAKREIYYANIKSYIEFYQGKEIESSDYDKALVLIDKFIDAFDWTNKVRGVKHR
jgi:hypothetical protein